MGQDAAVELLRQRFGGPVPDRLAEQLLRRTDSDPTLLDAILDQVSPTADGFQRVPLRWPPSLTAEILSTLDGLPSLAREVLEVGAVIGREFDLAIVERACPGVDVLSGLEAAEELVQPLPGHVFSFRRALLREVCYDTLGARRRAWMHERVAEALTALGATSGARAATVVELAYHLGEAAALGGGERLDGAAAAAATAGATAAAEGAHDLAAEYFAQATMLAGRAGWAPAQAGRLMVAAGTARLRAARTADESALGRAALTAAVRMGHRAEDQGLIAAAALGFGPRPTLGPLAVPSGPQAPNSGAFHRSDAAPRPRRAPSTVVPGAGASRGTALPGPAAAGGPGAAFPGAAVPGGTGAAVGGRGERWEALTAAVAVEAGLDPSVRARLAARLAVETGRAELAVQSNALAHESGDPRAVAEAGLAVAQLTGDRLSLQHAAREAAALDDVDLIARALDLESATSRGEARLAALRRLAELDGPQVGALVRWYAKRAAHAIATLTHDSRAEELGRQALEAGRAVDPGIAEWVGRPTQSNSDIERQPTAHLTSREREVLAWALKGVSSKEIAEHLVLGERTVETHLANIYRKLEVRGRVDLIMKFKLTDG
jgi:DNA-binding CsgD family transcriptional regulator